MICLSVILLCHRIICLGCCNKRLCNKKGVLFVSDSVYVNTYNIFLIHSFVSGRSNCIHILDIVNNAAVNLGYRYFFRIVISFLSDTYPEVGSPDHMVVLFLMFWGTYILSSIEAVPIYLSIDSAQEFPFYHILANICYLLSF